MKRKRGRPPGAAKFWDDVALVEFVRLASDRGIKVKAACAEYRRLHGTKVGTVQQLEVRYLRVADKYPGKVWEETVRLKTLAGFPVKVKRFGPSSPAAKFLSWPTRKPS